MSWKKMDSEMKNVAFQELACMLIGLLAGIGLAHVYPHYCPAGIRYILGFLIGWNVFGRALISWIAHRGTDVHLRLPRS